MLSATEQDVCMLSAREKEVSVPGRYYPTPPHLTPPHPMLTPRMVIFYHGELSAVVQLQQCVET